MEKEQYFGELPVFLFSKFAHKNPSFVEFAEVGQFWNITEKKVDIWNKRDYAT